MAPDDKLDHLLQALHPEFTTLLELAKEMAKINSPYKGDFNYIKVLEQMSKQAREEDIEKKVKCIVAEFGQFSQILQKISDDAENRELYLNAGLLEKCLNLQKNISRKLNAL